MSSTVPHNKEEAVGSTIEDNKKKGHLHGENTTILECAKYSFLNFLNSFILSYGIRTTVSVLLRALFLLRTQPKALLSLRQLLDEKNLVVRVDAVKLGLTIGCN